MLASVNTVITSRRSTRRVFLSLVKFKVLGVRQISEKLLQVRLYGDRMALRSFRPKYLLLNRPSNFRKAFAI